MNLPRRAPANNTIRTGLTTLGHHKLPQGAELIKCLDCPALIKNTKAKVRCGSCSDKRAVEYQKQWLLTKRKK